jgi:hypothetical protein
MKQRLAEFCQALLFLLGCTAAVYINLMLA